MSSLKHFGVFLSALLLPMYAFAGTVTASSDAFDIIDILVGIVERVIPVLIGGAVIVFFWGIVKFVAHADDEKAVTEGKQFIIWGLVGLFVIVAMWSLVGYIQRSLGLNVAVPATDAPTLPTELPVID